ncbi:MAG: hypothetical protein KJO45_07070, partial [Sulfurovum sp.]|nr:hypothetical protein [Sulfurovum sp.]
SKVVWGESSIIFYFKLFSRYLSTIQNDEKITYTYRAMYRCKPIHNFDRGFSFSAHTTIPRTARVISSIIGGEVNDLSPTFSTTIPK